MKNKEKNILPDLEEFTDEEGNKWIQTSVDDLLGIDELNKTMEALGKDKNNDEIILAKIDFKKVNKEYYNTAIELKKKLDKQQELLKKIASNSKEIITKKNNKLEELIAYIKKLHTFIAYVSANQENLEDIEMPTIVNFKEKEKQEIDEPKKISEYEEVEEIVLDLSNDAEEQLK